MASARIPPPVAEMPEDWKGEALGTCAEVRALISKAIPEVDWTDPAWGVVELGDASLEFNIGEGEPIDGIMIHARGDGGVVKVLFSLAEATGWFFLDCSEGEWFHHMANPDASWEAFRQFRDKIFDATS